MKIEALVFFCIIFFFMASPYLMDSGQFNAMKQYNHDMFNNTQNVINPSPIVVNLGLINGTIPFSENIVRYNSLKDLALSPVYSLGLYLSGILNIIGGYPIEIVMLVSALLFASLAFMVINVLKSLIR